MDEFRMLKVMLMTGRRLTALYKRLDPHDPEVGTYEDTLDEIEHAIKEMEAFGADAEDDAGREY